MAEQKIDQEIDFTVQRESRTDALATASETQSQAKQPNSKRFKRLWLLYGNGDLHSAVRELVS